MYARIETVIEETRSIVNGWAGPGMIADGVVYNQMFDRMPRYQLLRQLKHMIFAAPS